MHLNLNQQIQMLFTLFSIMIQVTLKGKNYITDNKNDRKVIHTRHGLF